MQRVTIETVCQATGLSRGTVSRALNNRADINQQTRQRVIDVCRQLNYRPNHAARALATGRSAAVGLIVQNLGAADTIAFMRGVLSAAASVDFSVSILELASDPQAANSQISGLEILPLDGIIVSGDVVAPMSAMFSAGAESRPVAAAGVLQGVECDIRRPDRREAGRVAARTLAEGGARCVEFLHSPGSSATEQVEGFLELREEFSRAGAATIGTDTNLVEWLATRDRVEAFATANDELALRVINGLIQCGRTPGEDVALIGYGNSHWIHGICPSLSTIDPGTNEIGKWAFQAVHARVTGQKTGKGQVALHPPERILRASHSSAKALSE